MFPLRSVQLLCVVLAALLGASRKARAEDPPQAVGLLSVEVTALESGQTLHGVRCGLQRAGARSGYARFAAPVYRGKLAVQAGDLLHVYVRGRDFARVTLTKGQRSAKVALKLATRQCAIKLEGADMEGVRSRLTWWIGPAGSWNRSGPISDRVDQSMVGATARRTVPAGADIFLTVEPADAIAWPRMAAVQFAGGAVKPRKHGHEKDGDKPQDEADPDQQPGQRPGQEPGQQPGGTVTLNVDRAWRPVVRLRANSAAPHFDFFPDYAVRASGPPRRNDAWRWAVAEPWWGREQGGPRDGKPHSILPAIPFHIVGTYGQVTIVRRVLPEGRLLDLSAVPAHRTLETLPLVDGRPVPIGTSILPGRLDLSTVGGFLDVAMGHARLAINVTRRIAEGKVQGWAMELPAADWLTIWHPQTGMAHLQWKPGETPTGQRYTGGLVIRAPKGWVMDGKVFAFSGWKGTGRVNTTPPLQNLGRALENVPSLRYAGLPSGWYTFMFELELLEPVTGRRHVVKRRIQREIKANVPPATYELPVPG